MVQTGLMTSIREMTYSPAGRSTAAVETMTLERLHTMNDGGTQRADFHVLALIDAGHGFVTVDFSRHPLAPRSCVWIAPGAVHRWDDITGLFGDVVLFVPTAPVTHATRELVVSPDLVPQWTIPDDEWEFVDAARNHLVLEAAAAPGRASTELPAILLTALIARLQPPHGGARPTNPVFRVFRASVEAHFREHHDVEYYGRALGYAPRTLSRAAQQVTGRTAKAHIVDRIVLEAKRLLAHDRLTAANCATTLGFLDASNFSVFFRNATGMRPGAWQAMATRTTGTH